MPFFTYQVVPQELHDQSRVLVALLRQGVELCVLVSTKTTVFYGCTYQQ
jgi:hypothetical protein